MDSDTFKLVKHKIVNCVYLYGIGLLYILFEFIGTKLNLFPKCSIKDLGGEKLVAVVTGGTRGIGYEAVRHFLSLGMTVIIGSSSSEEKRKAIEDSLSTEYPKGKVELWHLDLESLKSVRDFADRFLASRLPLHYLVNNAGVMFVPYKLTEDGFEHHLAVNFLSHCLLTELLLPALVRGAESRGRHSRIVNSSSLAHYGGSINFDDLHSKKYYSCHHGYMQSKLAQVAYMYQLNKRLRSQELPVSTVAIHPGIVRTDLYHFVTPLLRWSSIFYMSPQQGGETLVFATLDPSLEGRGGSYLMNNIRMLPSPLARDPLLQARLWEETRTLLRPLGGSALLR